MKIIDLLNKIANGEIKDGFRVKRPNGIYEYREGTNHFVNIEDAMYVYSLGDFTKLNDEVEILDEEDEFEDIENIRVLKDATDNDELLAITINKLMNNQKKIIERLKDESR